MDIAKDSDLEKFQEILKISSRMVLFIKLLCERTYTGKALATP